jgi:hypothetical protein
MTRWHRELLSDTPAGFTYEIGCLASLHVVHEYERPLETTTQLVRFACTETGKGKNGSEFEVLAEETLRPVVRNGVALGSRLEWQFYIEELNLILIRKTRDTYTAADNDGRVFRSNDRRQPRFKKDE